MGAKLWDVAELQFGGKLMAASPHRHSCACHAATVAHGVAGDFHDGTLPDFLANAAEDERAAAAVSSGLPAYSLGRHLVRRWYVNQS